MTRKECLEQAMKCVLRDRNREYGEPEQSFNYIADLWSAYLRTKIEPYDAAAMMALFKLARLRWNPSYEDGWADLAGYAACGAELAGAEKAREDATRRWGEEYKKLIAKAEGGYRPKGKDHSSEEPEFKPGDAVEWNSIGRGWRPAVYLREANDPGYCIVQTPDGRELLVARSYLRRPEAMAEGCEDLVRDEAEECRDCDGFQDGSVPEGCEGCMKTLEADAPRTPHELYRKIIASNPATFGRAHKPTGEELAEMAEEEKRG